MLGGGVFRTRGGMNKLLLYFLEHTGLVLWFE